MPQQRRKLLLRVWRQGTHLYRMYQRKKEMSPMRRGPPNPCHQCPERKRIIQETDNQKVEKQKEQENRTYSEVAKQVVKQHISATKEIILTTIKDNPPKINQAIIQLPNDTSIEILTIVINAHLMCLKNPSHDYNVTANRGLRMAGLPEVTLGYDDHSTNILRVLEPKDNTNIAKAHHKRVRSCTFKSKRGS